jgi:hypothetical protein
MGNFHNRVIELMPLSLATRTICEPEYHVLWFYTTRWIPEKRGFHLPHARSMVDDGAPEIKLGRARRGGNAILLALASRDNRLESSAQEWVSLCTKISTSRTNAEFRHIRERQPGRVCLLLIPSILIFSQFSDIGDSPL